MAHARQCFKIVEIISSAAGTANEDRAGSAGDLAWVIDGATDVVAEPLTRSQSDAAWFADLLDLELRRLAAIRVGPLSELPMRLAAVAQRTFDQAAQRPALDRGEHPSASGIIVRVRGTTLEYVSLGDCVLLAETRSGFLRVGIDEDSAGDAWVADEIRRSRAANPAASVSQAREDLWAKLRAARRRMNMPDGYGVFSLTVPPPPFIQTATIELDETARVLLATDGLTRLVDVFATYRTSALFDAAWSRGLSSLVKELRRIEADDADCIRHARAKTNDDATGVLLRLTNERP